MPTATTTTRTRRLVASAAVLAGVALLAADSRALLGPPPQVEVSTPVRDQRPGNPGLTRAVEVDRGGVLQVQVRTGPWSWSSVSTQHVPGAGTTNVSISSFNERSSHTYRVLFVPDIGPSWASAPFTVQFPA